ncbi:uncharacterized protein LOC126879898 isoform X2 [Diabrotica virgifera virgifera]|uniref:CHK kinase-like domain-containing protein n=1 Tax=Diabrotica virgifera virgifera TaxID=50390 RepID=A0ABM5JMP1_DIAVI|nr:uncharacterized protein LOC126879898 isoform X2 [Diabrotica virgifera virgifera]
MDIAKEHRALVDSIARENGFTDYEVITSSGSSKGDNFLGVLTAITIKDKEKSLDLILKSSHTNKGFREATPIKEIFSREIYIYEQVFKEFKKFQEEHSIEDPFESVPKFYSSFAEDELEGLVMENLKTQQYELWDKKVPMNPGHIKAVLIEYAKFHAVSFAMKQKNPALFKKLSEKNGTNPFEKKNASEKDNEERYKKFFSDTLSNGYKVLKDDPELTEKLKKYEQIVDTEFMSKLKEPEYKLVITHGDCWCNNFLFKYQDPNDKTKPEDLRIVDWQISSFGSPCADLAYFLLVNSSEEVLDDIQTYLKIYHGKLSSHLRNFNLDPDELFPFSTFQHHLNLFLLQSFFYAFLLFKIMLSDKEDIPDHVEAVDKSRSC